MSSSTSIIRISHDQYQQVLDAYGAGAIRLAHEWHGVTLHDNEHSCPIARVIIETNKGLFLLVHAPNKALHPIWWEKDAGAFLELITPAVGLTFAEPLHTQTDDTVAVHRFDERFTLFQL
jgi:hypothetical protein